GGSPHAQWERARILPPSTAAAFGRILPPIMSRMAIRALIGAQTVAHRSALFTLPDCCCLLGRDPRQQSTSSTMSGRALRQGEIRTPLMAVSFRPVEAGTWISLGLWQRRRVQETAFM